MPRRLSYNGELYSIELFQRGAYCLVFCISKAVMMDQRITIILVCHLGSLYPNQSLAQWTRLTRSHFVGRGNHRVTCVHRARLRFEVVLPIWHTHVLKDSNENYLSKMKYQTCFTKGMSRNHADTLIVTHFSSVTQFFSAKNVSQRECLL